MYESEGGDQINSFLPPQSSFQILNPYLGSKESCHHMWNYSCRPCIKSPNPLSRIECKDFILFSNQRRLAKSLYIRKHFFWGGCFVKEIIVMCVTLPGHKHFKNRPSQLEIYFKQLASSLRKKQAGPI